MIDLGKEKDRIEKIIKSIERSFSFKSVLFNERYLHHYFSHKWLSLYENENLIFHPEWPTYKKATGIDYGKYKYIKENKPGILNQGNICRVQKERLVSSTLLSVNIKPQRLGLR